MRGCEPSARRMKLDPTGVAPPGALEFLHGAFDERGPLSPDDLRANWIDRQRALCCQAVALFGADVRATTSLDPPPFESRTEADGIRLAYWGSFATIPVISITAAEVAREVCDFMQGEVVESCTPGGRPARTTRLAHAKLVEGQAVWYCRKFGHVLALVGNLPH